MAKKDKVPKWKRQELRERQARRKRTQKRLRLGLLLSAPLLLIALFVFEQSGSDEIVEAEVIRTRRWQHLGQTGSHTHIKATLSIEGLAEFNLDRADGYQRGQRVPVWIRRGRITGWIFFQDLASPGEIGVQRQPSVPEGGP